MSREQAAALQEVTVDEYKEGRGEGAKQVKRVKLKLCDKRQSLVDIGKHLGMFIDRHEIKHEFSDLTDEELEQRAKSALLGGASPQL